MRAMQWTVPQPVLDGLRFPAQAAIPLMLVLLGAQLANATVGQYWRTAAVGSGLSLLIAPLVAFGLANLFNLGVLTRQAVVLEASMPAAVVNTLIATEFDAEPQLVTSTVVLSTLAQPDHLEPDHFTLEVRSLDMRRVLLALFIVGYLLHPIARSAAQAAGITFTSLDASYTFADQMIFTATASSSSPITQATVFFQSGSQPPYSHPADPFTAATVVSLTATIDLKETTSDSVQHGQLLVGSDRSSGQKARSDNADAHLRG